LALDAGEDLRPFQVVGLGDAETEQEGGGRVPRIGFGPDRLRVVVLDLLAGGGVVALGDVAEPDLREVGQFGHCADGGARGLDRVGLLDGDGRPDVLDAVYFGLVEQVEELAGVGAEGLDVAPLALGVQSVEHQGGLAGAAQAGDDDELAQGEIEIEALEVVLADAAQADGLGGG
jgi:hypothetical protein